MDKNHVVGAVVGIILSILGAVGIISTEGVKAGICGAAPAEQVAK